MVRRKEAEVSTLIYVVLAMILLSIDIPNESVGIAKGCDWFCRFTYQFFHASWIHLLVNCWTLLCVVFYYETSMPMILLGYIVSASVPIGIFPLPEGVVTIGISGLVFFLMGSISFKVKRKKFYQAWVLGFILLGFFFGSCNAWLHLYCYAVGILTGKCFPKL